MDVTIETIEGAYRKLKSAAYYNRSDLLLTRKLALYESEGDIETKLRTLLDNVNAAEYSQEYFQALFLGIRRTAMPKSLKIPESDLPENVITNERRSKSFVAERVTYFIDAPVELLILNVLWIVVLGYKIDSKLRRCCLGNRLSLNSEAEVDPFNATLFKPYHEQYQKWRDEGLEAALKLLHAGSDVAFISLDIQDFYHSVKINYQELRTEVEYDILSPMMITIHHILEETHRYYNRLFRKGNKNSFFLPIGLPSSYVLANYHLSEFDRAADELVRPEYYARYVDDIVFVIKNPISPHTIAQEGEIKIKLLKNL